MPSARGPGALQPIVAYVDLNCVRAGLMNDPKEYRFCGYAEAVAGNQKAQAGFCSMLGVRDWASCQMQYRTLLFGTAGVPRAAVASLSARAVQRVIEQGGMLPLTDLLHCRIRYFTAGAFFMPFLAATLLYLNNRREWLGESANGRLGNGALLVCLVVFGLVCGRELLAVWSR